MKIFIASILLAVLVIGGLGWKVKDEREARELREQAAREQAARAAAFREMQHQAEKAAFERDFRSLQIIARRWVDALAVAHATSRINLNGPVATLQAIKREAATVQPSGCIKEAVPHLVQHMEMTIEGFIDFMENKYGGGKIISAISFDSADKAMTAYSAAIQECTASVPAMGG